MQAPVASANPEGHSVIPNARPRRILVIGGGPSGLVTLRNLRERGDFDEVQLVERRNDVGGVWYLDKGRWPSPAYPGLIGNVLPEFLSFSSFSPFPQPPSTATGQPFPSLAETHAYLRAFAKPMLAAGAIRLNTEVLAVEELPARKGWRVRMRVWSEGGEYLEKEEVWDAVVIAVAFYDSPAFPATPGIERLPALGIARHAQGWRGPQGYEGKRVLVIGNANSGNDIAAQLAPIASAVFQSIRRPNFPGFPSLPDTRITRVAPVAEYTEHEQRGTADARLTDGTLVPDLDYVLFGTGYLVFPGFVRVRASESSSDEDKLASLVSPSFVGVPNLHRYTLYAPNPSLAFVGTAFACYTPFTVADLCSTWLALAWSPSGGIAYPTTLEDLLAFERERLKAVEAARAEMSVSGEASSMVSYTVLGPFEEPFAAALRAEIVHARPELGDVLPVWSPERTEVREAMFGLKRRALELARDRDGMDRNV